MRIQNNVPALNAHRYYGINQTGVTKSIAKLSSGYRINSAADDAAGLAISEKMRAQIRGLTMASKNTQDGISLIQTAEGGMQEIDNMLQRIRELVVYASNDTQEYNATNANDRQKIQDEIDALVAEIDSMSDRVEFNKKKIINGDYSGRTTTAAADLATAKAEYIAAKSKVATLQNQQDTEASNASKTIEQIKNKLAEIATAANGFEANIAAASGQASAIRSAADAISAIITEDDLITDGLTASISGIATSLAAIGTSLSAAMTYAGWDNSVMTGYQLAIKEAVSDITALSSALASTLDSLNTNSAAGTRYALGSAISDQGTKYSTLATKQIAYEQDTGGESLYFQIGANAGQGIDVTINKIKSDMLGIGDGNGFATLDVVKSTGSEITNYLDTLDEALSYVTAERSKLGALQNRMEYTKASLDISAENLTDAESRIRDIDMAKEMTQFTKMNILFQASTAMLAQANALPQGVLQMLG